jgi:Leucine-rich repeat (LRR) protein
MKSIKFIFILLLLFAILWNQNPVLSQSKVFIPDINFRNFLNTNYPTFMDLSGDSLIVDSAATFIGNIDCSNQNIENLTGIEYFQGIYRLDCNNNQLTSLPDLSAVTTLLRIYCHDNKLTLLPDLSGNTSLLLIDFNNNQLSSLPDLSNNTALKHLLCNNNQLTSLPDLSSNIDLLYLHVDNNQLTSLPDLSNNINLSELNCNGNQLTSLPDLSNNTALYDLACNSNNLTGLPDLTANTALKYIYCHSNNLTSLPDLSNCSPLVTLVCDYNQLTSLPDLSANKNLHTIYCTYNQLTSLPDLSGNNALQVFDCGFNKLDFSDARELRIADTLSALNKFYYTPQLPFGDAYSTCILEGDSAILSIAAQDSALSYQWFKNNIAISGATDTILVITEMTFADTGIYTCKSYGTALESPPMIWGPGISEFVSAPVTVKINLPCSFSGLNSYYFIWEDSVMLTGSPPGGTFSGPGINGNYFVPSTAGEGTYIITYSYTSTNGCTSTYSQEVEVFMHGGIEQPGLIDDLRIYPNPAKGRFNIEMNITKKQYVEIKVLNNLGREIARKELKDYSDYYITSFDLKEYPPGIYYLQILIDERKIIKKIIIE